MNTWLVRQLVSHSLSLNGNSVATSLRELLITSFLPHAVRLLIPPPHSSIETFTFGIDLILRLFIPFFFSFYSFCCPVCSIGNYTDQLQH